MATSSNQASEGSSESNKELQRLVLSRSFSRNHCMGVAEGGGGEEKGEVEWWMREGEEWGWKEEGREGRRELGRGQMTSSAS